MMSQENEVQSTTTSASVSSTNIDMITPMFGAIVGDIAGSTYEHSNCKNEDEIKIFRKDSDFTDDTVLTVATAHHLLNINNDNDSSSSNDIAKDDEKEDVEKPTTSSSYASVYQAAGRRYPYAGYGGNFRKWVYDQDSEPYNSWGNGSAMRASPIAWAAPDLEWALEQAEQSASVTHNHPEGIKGAQAVVAATFLARTGHGKDYIKKYVVDTFGYDLDRTIDEIRPYYRFDVSCQGSVPEAILAFLESENFEHAIVKAISLGGDSDTIACITGAIAHAFYKTIPEEMVGYARNVLDESQLDIHDAFWKLYPPQVIEAAVPVPEATMEEIPGPEEPVVSDEAATSSCATPERIEASVRREGSTVEPRAPPNDSERNGNRDDATE